MEIVFGLFAEQELGVVVGAVGTCGVGFFRQGVEEVVVVMFRLRNTPKAVLPRRYPVGEPGQNCGVLVNTCCSLVDAGTGW